MRKIGFTAATKFDFPVGHGTTWRRIGATPQTTTAAGEFEAMYRKTAYTNTTSMLTLTPDFLNNVSVIEHWFLTRMAAGTDAAVTLYWEDAAASGINSCAAPTAGDLCVARFNGTNWVNENYVGSTAGSVSGSCTGSGTGSITSRNWVTAFSPFTFGSKSGGVNPLPVELLSFDAKPNGNIVEVKWSTASEFNSDYFMVQHSPDGINFQNAGKVNASGNSTTIKNYSSADYEPYGGVSYYRLKQVDNDGKFTFSNVVSVEMNSADEISVYPNPSSGSFTIYGFNSPSQIKITNVLGEIIFETSLSNKKETISLNAAGGIYILTAVSPGKIFEKKIIIK